MLASPIVEVRGVSHSYAMKAETITAVDEVSFVISSGEYVALMGPSGCGKTTLMSLISGLLPITSGSVSIVGTLLETLNPEQRAAFRLKNIGVVFQDTQLIPEFSVIENVMLPLELAGAKGDVARAEATSALNRVGLGSFLDRFPDEISGGQAQRVGIARAIVGGRKVLLADEPTGNLDKENSLIVFETLGELAKSGLAVLVSTHDPLAAEFVSRTLPMSDGKILK